MPKTKVIKLDDKFGKRLVEWFKNAPLYETILKEVYNKKQDKLETIEEKVAATCPSLVRFAEECGLNINEIKKWKDSDNKWANYYAQALSFQEEWLMNSAGLGFYNSSMSIMALKANHGWMEKQDAKSISDEIKQVLVKFVEEKGENIEESNGAYSRGLCSLDAEPT